VGLCMCVSVYVCECVCVFTDRSLVFTDRYLSIFLSI
jgi:hypothetical protein